MKLKLLFLIIGLVGYSYSQPLTVNAKSKSKNKEDRLPKEIRTTAKATNRINDLLFNDKGKLKSKFKMRKRKGDSKEENEYLVTIHKTEVAQFENVSEAARYEIGDRNLEGLYIFKGDTLGREEFLSKKKRGKKRRKKRKFSFRNIISEDDKSIKTYLTKKEIRHLIKKEKNIVIDEVKEPESQLAISAVLGALEIKDLAFSNGYDGSGIGLYFTETGCADYAVLNSPRFRQIGGCPRGIARHAVWTAATLQSASPDAHIYGFDQNNLPANPHLYNPPIYIGSHSWSIYEDNKYRSDDMAFDNYIYEHGIIMFISAGNQHNLAGGFYVQTPGKSLNSMAVGAVDPFTLEYAFYSRWDNPETWNQKPEVSTYTNFQFLASSPVSSYLPNNKAYDGTSASTPLMAGIVANLLEQHPFYLKHPEMVKALLLVGSSKEIRQAKDHDKDNRSVGLAIPMYSDLAWNTRSAYWNGSNTSFFDSNEEIRFTERNIKNNKKYKIAISWLTPGTYIYNHKRIAQDIDLKVYQNGERIARSTSAFDPFEMVEFTTTSNANLEIVIERYRNSGVGDVKLGYIMSEQDDE